jgi:hypothetical protein
LDEKTKIPTKESNKYGHFVACIIHRHFLKNGKNKTTKFLEDFSLTIKITKQIKNTKIPQKEKYLRNNFFFPQPNYFAPNLDLFQSSTFSVPPSSTEFRPELEQDSEQGDQVLLSKIGQK